MSNDQDDGKILPGKYNIFLLELTSNYTMYTVTACKESINSLRRASNPVPVVANRSVQRSTEAGAQQSTEAGAQP